MDLTSLSDEEIVRHAQTIDEKLRPAFLMLTLVGRERIPNRRKFIERYFKIRDKEAEIIPLIPNYAQRKLESRIVRARRRGMPPRIITLKARQTGYSTYSQAVLFEEVVRRRNVRAKVMGDDEDTAAKMLLIFKRFIQNMPRSLRMKPKSDRDDRIVFGEPHYSSIDIGSSKGKPIHGDTIQALHATEVSRWKDPEEHMKGLLQNVPKNVNTFVHMESTAFGAQGYFYDKFWSAYNGDGLYDWIFVPWFEHEEYRVPCPKGMEEEIKATLKPEEEWLLEQTAPHPKQLDGRRVYFPGPVSYEQILWRRFTFADECSSDANAFMEQYPATPDEAFISTGSPYFDATKVREMQAEVEEPIFQGDVHDLDYKPEVAFGQTDVVLNALDPHKMRDVKEVQQKFEAMLAEANKRRFLESDVTEADWGSYLG